MDANPKETDLTYVRPGQPVRITVDAFPSRQWRGRVAAISPGTGAQFAILPPQNAAGNWIKIVQRVPVRIEFEPGQDLRRLRSGMSATVEIDTGHRGTLSRAVRLERRGAGRRSMTAQARAAASTPSLQRLLITICVMMATIMQVLDITIANVSLPYMQGSLSATLDQVSWVLTSYVVAAAVMTAPVGWLASRFGIKKLLVICVTGFTARLHAVRHRPEHRGDGAVPRAAGHVRRRAGAAVAVGDARNLSAERRGWAMSLWGMGVMIGPIMGPILGGLLTEYYSWRWVFFINLPFGIATVLGLLAFMDETEGNRTLAFDWFGFAALSIAIGALQLHARPRRAARLVRFRRDRADGHRLGRRLLLLHRPLADHGAALHLHRDLPRPQLRHRPGLHVRVRRAAGGDAWR